MYNNELDGEMIFTLERWMVDTAGETSQKNLQYSLNIKSVYFNSYLNIIYMKFRQNCILPLSHCVNTAKKNHPQKLLHTLTIKCVAFVGIMSYRSSLLFTVINAEEEITFTHFPPAKSTYVSIKCCI